MARVAILIYLLTGVCPTFGQGYLPEDIARDIGNARGFSQCFVGFALYDLAGERMLYEHFSHKFMTPASNVKLFSFYAGIKMLGENIPALGYKVKGDSLIFWGTANPLFLHPSFDDRAVLDFLKERKEKLFYAPRPMDDQRLGPGWSWDDYNFYFSTEKATFPIYGNHTTFYLPNNASRVAVLPHFFRYFLTPHTTTVHKEKGSFVNRDPHQNLFTYHISPNPSTTTVQIDTLRVPFRYSNGLFLKLLMDTLGRKVAIYPHTLDFKGEIYYAARATDELYKEMLHNSDNFLAEQLLLMASSTIGTTLSSDATISYIQEHYFKDWKDELLWVDGSGLSRYNMFTPRTLIRLLELLYADVDEKRLFELLPPGGVSGTTANWYKDKGVSYVFAKTGTLANNHALSGYLKTKKGKTMIFSFMVNHYPGYSSVVKREMQKILKKIYNAY